MGELSRTAVKKKRRAARIAAEERKRIMLARKKHQFSATTGGGRTAYSRALLKARQDERDARLAETVDPYGWHSIRTPEVILAERALDLGGALGSFPDDLRV